MLSPSYFVQVYQPVPLGGKPTAVNKYWNISIRIFYLHILNHDTHSLRSSASRIGTPFLSLRQHRRLHPDDFACEKKKQPRTKFRPPKRGISLGGQLPYRLRATKHASARTHKGSNSLDQRKRPSISTLIGMPTVTLPHVVQNSTKVPCNENLIYEVHFAQKPTAKYSTSSVSFFIITNQCTFFKLRLLHILLHQMAAIWRTCVT